MINFEPKVRKSIKLYKIVKNVLFIYNVPNGTNITKTTKKENDGKVYCVPKSNQS